MSKIDKTELTKGTKLTTHDAYTVPTSMRSLLNSANTIDNDGIVQPQYESKNGTFRVTWNIPWIGAEWDRLNGRSATNGLGKPYIIPFVLPPLQEFLEVLGSVNDTTPVITMTEFSYGFDTRGEPALITDPTCGNGQGTGEDWGAAYRTYQGGTANCTDWEDTAVLVKQWHSNENQGKLSYDIANRGEFKFSILSKSPTYFDESNSWEFNESIYNLSVPITSFMGESERLNPYAETDLNINFDPYKTYAVAIDPFTLRDPDQSGTSDQVNLAIVNLTISIKFKHKLVTRDWAGSVNTDPDNIPNQGLAKIQDTITVNVPGTNSTIEADSSNDGFSTATTTIDQVYRDKLQGGLTGEFDKPPTEHLCQDSGYEVIAVPLWGNQFQNQLTMKDIMNGVAPYQYCANRLNTDNAIGTPSLNGTLDYLGADATGGLSHGETMSRAIVPISYPMTIHHIFLAWNSFVNVIDVDLTDANTWWMKWYPLAQGACPVNLMPAGTYAPPLPAADEQRIQVYHEIGVGVGTGMRGGQYNMRQVCHYTTAADDLKPQQNPHYIYDKIRMNYNTSTHGWDGNMNDATITKDANAPAPVYEYPSEFPEWFISQLPLNSGHPGSVGRSFFRQDGAPATSLNYTTSQDAPFAIGHSYATRNEQEFLNPPGINATTGTSSRKLDPAAATLTLSKDQWLEVRWKCLAYDDQPVAQQRPYWVGAGGAGSRTHDREQAKVVHGYGGHWMYIIAKKNIHTDTNWQEPYSKGGI